MQIVCVNQGNYCGMGRHYVHILYDQIKRNTKKDFKFICFTDDPEPYEEPIEKRSLPSEPKGWFCKIYLLSKEAGLTGQTFFFDLDTIITSNIDDILYPTHRHPDNISFCMLQDFYHPEGLGSGLMSWNGDFSPIWNEYKKEGYPDIVGGDQAWIEKYVRGTETFQRLYKGIYSYKQDCERWPPADAKIVCFHGEPKPHEIKGSWVELIWKIGGARNITEPADCSNVSEGEQKQNVIENCKLDLPWFIPYSPNNKTLCIVGGSPSLKGNLGLLREKIRLGARVMSVNGSLNFLTSKGIKPDYHAQFDSRKESVGFVKEAPEGVKYFIGSMSNPQVFDELKGKDVTLWHGGIDLDEIKIILEPYNYRPILVVGGGETIGLRAMTLGYHMGFHKISVFGMDSSFSGKEHHAYSQPLNDLDGRIDVWHDGKKYECAGWMYRQAAQFEELYKHLTKEGCKITVIGNGLIPDICKYMEKK